MHPLEKRREMNGTFPGRIVLVEGDEVDVDLQIAADKVRLATPFAEIGLWDRQAIHFERNSTGGYELSVADDVVTFYPSDLSAFAEAVGDVPDAVEQGARDLRSVVGAPPVSVVPEPDELEEELEYDEAVHEEPGFEEVAAVDQPVEAPDVEEVPAGEDDRAPEPDEDPASRFGPSSRERLAAAMSGFRARQDSGGGDVAEELEAPVEERTSSPGFVIPGDAGYAFPTDADRPSIHFDEEVEESTVADDIMATQRSLRGASTLSLDRDKLKKTAIGIVVLAVLVGLGFAVPVVIGFFSGGEDATAPTVVATTVPVTEAPPTSVASTTESTTASTTPTTETAFQLSPEGFVERWNDTAAQVSPSLRLRSSLPAGDFEVGFTEYIAMIGSSGATPSGLSAFTLEIDPTGPSSSDRLGIQALGLAIAVADPALEPNERGAVLAAMGLDVRNPDLEGLDGIFDRNGVGYRLVYDAEALMLRLTISPA